MHKSHYIVLYYLYNTPRSENRSRAINELCHESAAISAGHISNIRGEKWRITVS
jgi:hypothetical protein